MNSYIRMVIWIGLLCVAGCREDAAAPPVEVDVYFRYLQDQNKYQATASFAKMEKDSALNFLQPENVLFNGRPMEGRPLGDAGYRYQIDFSGPYEKQNLLEFWNGAEAHVRQLMVAGAIEDFSFEGTISKKSGAELSMDAMPFGANEHLLLIFNTLQNETGSVAVPQMEGKHVVNFPPEALISLYPGENKVYLIRQNQDSTHVGDVFIKWQSEFYTKEKKVSVVKE